MIVMAALQMVRRNFFIPWKRLRLYLPAIALMVLVGMIPSTTGAEFAGLSNLNTALNGAKDSLRGIVKVLAILGIMIGAVGMFLGNAGDGVKKLLVISIALAVAAYATEWAGNFMP